MQTLSFNSVSPHIIIQCYDHVTIYFKRVPFQLYSYLFQVSCIDRLQEQASELMKIYFQLPVKKYVLIMTSFQCASTVMCLVRF